MPNNFLTLNPTCANQESDATYSSDSTRTGGYATDQIVPSPLLNKFSYQTSIFVAAFAAMLQAKGYIINDGSAAPSTALTNLAADLATVQTNTDVINSTFAASQQGFVLFGPTVGNFQIAWGKTTALSVGSNVINIGAGSAFTSNPVVLIVPCNYSSGWAITYAGVTATSSTQFTVELQGSGSGFAPEFFWVAVGLA
jgi:hypothetical protein